MQLRPRTARQLVRRSITVINPQRRIIVTAKPKELIIHLDDRMAREDISIDDLAEQPIIGVADEFDARRID